MGERLNGIQEVRGSIPLASTAGPSIHRGSVWMLVMDWQMFDEPDAGPSGSVLRE